jgi:site-specific recombinase XerD
MFHHINRNLLEDFEVYLFQVKHQSSNTVNKGVKTFKEFLNWLLSKNYIQNNDFKMYKPKTKNKDTDIFVLSETEINYIADYQISDKKMCAIRDLFIFSCFTGQRYSDVAKFSLENVVEVNNKLYWKLKQKKTSNNVMIPLNTKVIDIVKKYRNGLPIQISLDKYNDNIKKLAKMLNFVEPVTLNKLVGTKSVQVTKPKYELFSSHLGRRSFITYQLAKGTISSEVIMSVTGHKSYNEFKKYQKFSLNDIDKIHETSLN